MIAKIKELRAKGYSYKKISEELKISKTKVWKLFNSEKNEIETASKKVNTITVTRIDKVSRAQRERELRKKIK